MALKVGHVYEIPLKYIRLARFSAIFVTFQADFHPKMTPKEVENAFRGLRELHRRSRGTSEPVLEAKVVLRGSRKGGWEPSQPSQICCSVGKNEGCRPGGGIPTGAPSWSAPGPPAEYHLYRLCTSAPPSILVFSTLVDPTLDNRCSNTGLGFVTPTPKPRSSRGRRIDWPAATAADPEKKTRGSDRCGRQHVFRNTFRLEA